MGCLMQKHCYSTFFAAVVAIPDGEKVASFFAEDGVMGAAVSTRNRYPGPIRGPRKDKDVKKRDKMSTVFRHYPLGFTQIGSFSPGDKRLYEVGSSAGEA
jgi:hypothetical protein